MLSQMKLVSSGAEKMGAPTAQPMYLVAGHRLHLAVQIHTLTVKYPTSVYPEQILASLKVTGFHSLGAC